MSYKSHELLVRNSTRLLFFLFDFFHFVLNEIYYVLTFLLIQNEKGLKILELKIKVKISCTFPKDDVVKTYVLIFSIRYVLIQEINVANRLNGCKLYS